MILFYLIAYEYDIFPNARGVPPQDHIVELDEALALIALLYAGLCVLILQRAPLPIAAEAGVASSLEAEDLCRVHTAGARNVVERPFE
jgi:hypothetical protein